MTLHVVTPLFDDVDASAATQRRVRLKMECFQPVGSFKIRGIGHLCERAVASGRRHFVSSSGGNAGLATAYAANRLGVAATVVVPSTTPNETQELLRARGAEVIVHGDVWDSADVHAREYAATAGATYVSPFDDPLIWEGHASLVDELVASGPKPEAIVVAVGGGGLLCGVFEGLHRNGWSDVEVIAAETHGAESLHRSVAAGQLVTLPAITSIAKSLGARRVASEALAWAQRHPVECIVVTDDAALRACVRFARTQRVLVEPACGAALCVAYDDHPSLRGTRDVVVVACGGVSVAPVLAELARVDGHGP